MSRRNYKTSEGSLGKYRREVPVPETLPVVDTDAVLRLMDWRERRYKKPFFDDLTAYFQFLPNPTGVERYTRVDTVKPKYPDPKERFVGREAVRAAIDARNQAVIDAAEATERQRLHVAKSAEQATALFMSVAYVRQQIIHDVLASINDNRPLDETAVSYAADAVQDLGLCLEEPYEHDFKDVTAKGRKTPQGLIDKINSIAPHAGAQMASFGAYASENPEALRSYEGVALLTATADEQQYRMGVWQPRHDVLFEVYPQLKPSREILELHVPLDEMLALQEQYRP